MGSTTTKDLCQRASSNLHATATNPQQCARGHNGTHTPVHCARWHGCEQSLARMPRRTRVQWWRWRMEPVVHGRKGESVSDGHCVRPRTEHVCRGAGWSLNRCAHHCSKKTSAHAKAAGQATAARGPGQQRGCMLFAHVCCIARAKIDNWKCCCRSRWSPCDGICCRCPPAAGPRLLCSDCSCARERHHLNIGSLR